MQNGHLCMPRAVLVDIKQVHHFLCGLLVQKVA